MRAVISVIGKDTVGILAKVSAVCEKDGVNILDVTQTILQDLFTMIMLVDLKGATAPFDKFKEELTALGEQQNLSIHTRHQDIFNSMHKI